MYAQAVRRCVNARFISRTHKTVQNVTRAQRNAIDALKTNRNIVIKPADKGGAIVIQNRTDYCKEAYRQLDNQEHYRRLPTDPTKEHTHQLNKLIKTFDPDLQSILRALIPRTPRMGDFYCLPKIHKANIPGRPIVSGNGTLCENLSGYVEGILKPIVQGTPSFCCDITDFLQKLSTHGPVEPGTFLTTMDVSALYTSIPHDDGIAATASVLNTNNSQSPDAILQLIRFILDHNVFTFDNQFFTQTHGTAMGTKFAPQYAKIFMHKFEHDFFTAQDLQPTLYTRYIDDIFFLWTHGEESLKRLHDNINKFHPTIKLIMDYSSESVSFLDTRISIKDRHLSISLYRKPTDNLTMLHFSSFHPNHVKEAIPYGQALRIHRICSDEEERDGHLQTLKDALVRTGYDARLVDRQFRRATAKNRIDLLRRQTRDATNRVPYVVQYFPGADKLRHVLRSLQHVIDDDEHLAKAIPTPPLLAFKQPPNLKQTIVRSKLPSSQENSVHDTTQPCHSNLCKTCQIIDADTTITREDTTHQVHGSYSCDSANVVYLIRCRKGCPGAWYIGKTMQTLRQRMNGHRTTIARQEGSLPVGEHFSSQGHSASDLRVSVLQGGLRDTRQRKIVEQKLIAKFRTHEDGLNRDLGFMSHYM
ncbi:uncharacterized protein [Heptranchias perlo]|uniref:uncharacterized protein n=1 Tax=Heptranchias perlo TaxID=212740 RepID=UPI00355965FF